VVDPSWVSKKSEPVHLDASFVLRVLLPAQLAEREAKASSVDMSSEGMEWVSGASHSTHASPTTGDSPTPAS
jgi:hypothetical protein